MDINLEQPLRGQVEIEYETKQVELKEYHPFVTFME